MKITVTIYCTDDINLETLIPPNKSISKIDYRVEKGSSRYGEVAADLVRIWNTLRCEEIRVTPLRISKTRARLDDKFTPEQLMAVVTKIASDPFYAGQNDRKWAAPGPEWVLHSIERVEQWLRKRDQTTETYADQVKKFF